MLCARISMSKNPLTCSSLKLSCIYLFFSAHGLQQLNMRNRRADNGNRFIYVNKELLVWNCQGYWKVLETTKGLCYSSSH